MRFSLRTMFMITLAICVLCTVLFAMPDRVALLIAFIAFLHVPATAVVGIMRFEGDTRHFCIGMAAATLNIFILNYLYATTYVIEEIGAMLTFVEPDSLSEVFIAKLMMLTFLGACSTSGLVGVAVGRLAMVMARPAEPDD